MHALSDYLIRTDRAAAMEEEVERVAADAMELALVEEAKAADRAEKLAISQIKAQEALRTIGTTATVRFMPKAAPPVTNQEVPLVGAEGEAVTA